MKIKGFSLFVCLLFVSGVFAQRINKSDSVQWQKLEVKPKTELERMTEKGMKLKITRQNLADVKAVVEPTLKTAGIPTDAKDVLVFVDGSEVSMETYKKLNPNDLSSISIVKNQEAIQTLTKKKCAMMVVVSTKKKPAAK